MAAITIDNLLLAAAREADMENSSFIGTAEGLALVNQEAAELHDLIVSRFEDQFTTVTASLTVAAGVDTIDLADTSNFPASAPFYKLRGVDRSEGGEWIEVQPFDFNERNRKVASSWLRGREVRYLAVGTNLRFTPTDGAAGTYRVWYVPGFVDRTTGQTFDYPQNWYAFVLFGVAARILEKEESDSSAKVQRKEQARQRILVMAGQRDASRGRRIVDVRRSSWEDWD